MRIFLVFGPGVLFLDLGTKIWTRDFQFWPGLARGGFWTKIGGPKNMVLFGNGVVIGDCGISRDPNGLYGTQEVFGRGGFPPNPTKKMFLGDFPYFGEFGGRPLAPCVSPIGPLWANRGLLPCLGSTMGSFQRAWGRLIEEVWREAASQ